MTLHIDNFAVFTKPGTVLLAWTDNQTDPQARGQGRQPAEGEAARAPGRLPRLPHAACWPASGPLPLLAHPARPAPPPRRLPASPAAVRALQGGPRLPVQPDRRQGPPPQGCQAAGAGGAGDPGGVCWAQHDLGGECGPPLAGHAGCRRPARAAGAPALLQGAGPLRRRSWPLLQLLQLPATQSLAVPPTPAAHGRCCFLVQEANGYQFFNLGRIVGDPNGGDPAAARGPGSRKAASYINYITVGPLAHQPLVGSIRTALPLWWPGLAAAACGGAGQRASSAGPPGTAAPLPAGQRRHCRACVWSARVRRKVGASQLPQGRGSCRLEAHADSRQRAAAGLRRLTWRPRATSPALQGRRNPEGAVPRPRGRAGGAEGAL